MSNKQIESSHDLVFESCNNRRLFNQTLHKAMNAKNAMKLKAMDPPPANAASKEISLNVLGNVRKELQIPDEVNLGKELEVPDEGELNELLEKVENLKHLISIIKN